MPDTLHGRAAAVSFAPGVDAPGSYAALLAGASAARDNFDVHVLACILTIGAVETDVPLTEAVGLDAHELSVLLAMYFPGVFLTFEPAPLVRAPDEDCLLTLLRQASAGDLASRWLAPMVARRAQRPDHLWQDLGLRARTELSELMRRHFRVLAVRNTNDMKWKKFLYRAICADAGFSLCTAPSCAECADFGACFGEETGESFLARARRAAGSAT